ncbi:hypothetical protein N9195_02695 [bacterium]|nr:hypothetical protein [bacterium]
MKPLVFFLTISSSLALPPLKEAREILSSAEMNEREALTRKIWKEGRNAIPLLEQLSQEENPEVFRRAYFVLQRLRMGLGPASTPELLQLAEAVGQSTPENRSARLAELLEHPEGAKAAMIFLDGWADDPRMPAEHIFKLGEVFTSAILESRTSWREFLSSDLGARCRGIIIAALSWEDLPMKSQMMAVLARKQTKEVFEMAITCPNQIAVEGYVEMARMATIGGDLPLALRILGAGLDQDTNPDLARSIAFLEVGGQVAPLAYEGDWKLQLDLFRARARRDSPAILALSAELEDDLLLAYESNLIAGALALPSNPDGIEFPEFASLEVIHESLSDPPGEPDIEALTSSVLIDWSELARTLLLLAHPLEAAERMASENQTITATGLLWRTQLRERAIGLAEAELANQNDKLHSRIRLTLASLHLDDGDLDKARGYFEPLIEKGVRLDARRSSALKLGSKLFSKEDLMPLASGLLADHAYQRASSIAGLLPYPYKVSTYWYEHFLKEHPDQAPLPILKKVEDFLSGDQKNARQIIEKEIASTKSRLLPTDALYQQALYLRTSGVLRIIEDAAWYQLSIQDLLVVIRDETWPAEIRRQALVTALQIDPANSVLHWFDQDLNDRAIPVDLHLPTLASPGLTLQLGVLTGKRKTIALAAELADLRDFQGLRCLSILASSLLKNDNPGEAARLLQTLLCGEIAAGTQPATSIQPSLDNLANYFEARKQSSMTPDEAVIWIDRLNRIGRN